MTTMSVPAARPAVFPPPSTPVLFADGDRYEWRHTGDVWTRTGGQWVPSALDDGRDDGTGWWSDAEVRASLNRAVVHWDVRHRFVPVAPGRILPGTALHSRIDLAHLPVGDFQPFAQYVRSARTGELVPLRDLIAERNEDFAYDVPQSVTFPKAADLLDTVLTEQARPEVSYDATTGRLYARYERLDMDWEVPRLPPVVECLHVFVLSTAPAEA
ncbi:hypothetical protein [Streptomyces sp. NPDC004267]|uniref:hypothetical protein n=1 Tax=Streptomyces sp. NPDC004267 TaxID=3364694 RepID=UPI003692423D